MLKKEFLAILYNKRKMFICFLFIFIICFDAYLAFRDSFLYESLVHPEFQYDLKMVYENTRQPFSAAFLSSASLGHIPQKMIIWLLPLYFLIISGDSYIQERKLNYQNIINARCSQKHIFLNQCLFSFLFAFMLSFIALMLNFIICCIVFFRGTRLPVLCDHIISIFSLQYPYFTYLIYMFIFSFTSGLLAASSKALCYIIPYQMPLYMITFGIWFYQIGAENSIAYVLQPFIEYGLEYLIPAYLFFIGISLLPLIIGYIKMVRYENI